MQETAKIQKITIVDRMSGTISGVEQILSFDEESALLGTGKGMLLLEGSGLLLKSLDNENGDVEFTGKIDSISYVKDEKKSFLKRLFS